MSWFRVDDLLWAHPKARRAGVEAMGFWLFCGSYASGPAAKGTGILTTGDLAAIAAFHGVADWPRLVSRLVDAGLFVSAEISAEISGEVSAEISGGYALHDWQDYRPEGDGELARRRTRDAERKRRTYYRALAEESAQNLRGDLRGGSAEDSPHLPDPSRPVPIKIPKPVGLGGAGGVLAIPVAQPPDPDKAHEPDISNAEPRPARSELSGLEATHVASDPQTAFLSHPGENSLKQASPSTYTRGKRLPEDWQPSDATVTMFPVHVVARSLPAFRDHWRASSGRNAVKLDWNAAFRNWCRIDMRREASTRQGSGQRQLLRQGSDPDLGYVDNASK